MDPIKAVLKFLQHELPFLPIPTEDEVLSLVSTEGHKALLDRFQAQARAVQDRLMANRWFPLPSVRAPEGVWHTLVSSVLYYVAEVAVSQHGLDNFVAGGLQGFFLQQILQRVDPAHYNVAGMEAALVADVGAALADLICPAGATPMPAPEPAPVPAPAPSPEPAPTPETPAPAVETAPAVSEPQATDGSTAG